MAGAEGLGAAEDGAAKAVGAAFDLDEVVGEGFEELEVG